MYKIDDITKFDLSDKKQYAIAKETLDRYELTQSEKKGLLEGIKNRGGDNGEYRYFCNIRYVDNSDYLRLINCGCEAISIMFDNITDQNEYTPIIDQKCTMLSAFGVFGFKIDLNMYNYGDNGAVLLKDNIYELLEKVNSENVNIVEITKEEYEQKSEIIKYTSASTSPNQSQEQITFFYNVIKKAYDKYNLENFYQAGLYYAVWVTLNDYYLITKIHHLEDEGFVLNGYYNGKFDVEYTTIYVDNTRISVID